MKQVTVKKGPTGEWFATFGVEMDREPPDPSEDPEKCVGIDVGILKYAHDTDGTAVGSLEEHDVATGGERVVIEDQLPTASKTTLSRRLTNLQEARLMTRTSTRVSYNSSHARSSLSRFTQYRAITVTPVHITDNFISLLF